MKTRNLFVALLLLISTVSWATTVTETITPADLIAKGVSLSDGSSTSFSNISFGYSTIKYAGNIGYDETHSAFYLTSDLNFSVSKSNYKVNSVTVRWRHDAATMSAKKNNLYVYYGDDAYAGTETNSSLKGNTGKAIAYTASPSTGNGVEIGDVKFFCMTSQKTNKTYFDQITIEWEEVSAFTVTIGSHTNGTIEINGSETPDDIEPGADVTMTLTPASGYELVSYTIGESTTNLSQAEKTSDPVDVHFDMPSSDVTVSAVFSSVLDRDETDTYITTTDGSYTLVESTSEYPIVMNVSETVEYTLIVEDLEDYSFFGGSVSNLSYSWANGGVATVTTFTYDGTEEEGVLEIEAVGMGTDVLTINFAQTDDYQASSVDIYIKVVVPTHTAALVAEIDGRYYAATKTLSAGQLVAEEVIVANGKVYYDSDNITASDISWVIGESTDGVDTYYTIQVAADGDYLTRSGASLALTSSAVQWIDVDGKPARDSRFIAYTGSSFAPSTTASIGAYEIATINAMPEAIERTQTNGNLSTLCLPFSIHRESPFIDGVGTVYNVSGVYKSGDKVVGIAMDEEVSTTLEAGKPYIFEASTSTLYVQYGEFTVAGDKGYATGLVGNLTSSKIYVPDNGYCYGLSNNVIRRVLPGASASIGAYKAYIDVEDLDEVGASPSPRRRVLYVENTSSSTEEEQTTTEEQIATSIEDLLGNMTLINWNEPVYNTLGQQVGKGTTGVLIQNGQKFIVQ